MFAALEMSRSLFEICIDRYLDLCIALIAVGYCRDVFEACFFPLSS